MIWHLIRYLLSFAIPAFYKRVEGKNTKNLITKGPAVIAMNHPNAFMDPICITYVSYPLRLKYMARGDAFKPGIVSFLLDQIGIVPIYRMRDGGKEGLLKNDESYRRVNQLLKRKAKIIIFAEGLCIQERRLRPLKKGVPRMVFGAYDFLKNKELVVIPVGVNYSDADRFRSDLFYNTGTPIKVSDFEAVYKENPAKAYNQFLQLLTAKMKELVTHINDPENDTLVVQLEEMVMQEWLQKMGLTKGLANEFKVSQYLTEIINNITESNKESIVNLRQRTANYFNALKKHGLKDWLLDPMNKDKVTKQSLALRQLFFYITLPINALGYLSAYLPYKATVKATKAIVKKNMEFYASFAVGLGAFIFLFNFLLWFGFIYVYSPNILWPLMIVPVLMGSAWFSLRMNSFMKKTKGLKRYLNLNAERKELEHMRSEIMNTLNGLTNF